MARPESYRCRLAGVTHRQNELARVKSPTRAALVREPRNPHDSNAVAVYVDGQHVGYIPREEASEIAPIMEKGEWTYVCPYMTVSWWDEGEIFTSWVTIEPRRPGADLIGHEHLPGTRNAIKPIVAAAASTGNVIAKATPVILNAAVTVIHVTWKGAGWIVARARPIGLHVVKAVDTRIVRLAGDDVFMRYFYRIGAVAVAIALVIIAVGVLASLLK